MGDICKTCGGDKDHPKKIVSYVKGGRRLGLFNGDVKAGCYIDSNGNFIGPDGYALDENGDILKDENNIPIMGVEPSWIDVEDFEYSGIPFTSIYESRIKKNGTIPLSARTDDGITIIDYLRLYDLRLPVPDQWLSDEQLMGKNALYDLWKRIFGDGSLSSASEIYDMHNGGRNRTYDPYHHHRRHHMTVEAFWVETYKEGDM